MRAVLVFASLTVLCACAALADQVMLLYGSGLPIGILVDGQKAATDVNDERHISSSGNTIAAGNFTPSPASNEIVAFTQLHPMAIRSPVNWTPGATDSIEVEFKPRITLPVTIWIVKGPFATVQAMAVEACLKTAQIWDAERMGLKIDCSDMRDATANPNAPNFLAFNCSLRTQIQNEIGRAPDRINIYYADTVDDDVWSGQSCFIGSDFVALARETHRSLLAHELGHNFTLQHVDLQLANFDNKNVMHSYTNWREFFSEGQTFRAHLKPLSAVNDTYSARPGLLTRDCPELTAPSDPLCPPLRKRIWSDDIFPPN